jgi:arsenate reductase (thioredoxin)
MSSVRLAVQSAAIVCLIGSGTAVIGAPVNQNAPQSPGKTGGAPTVLFMCPHGAAKSVLASAYFQRLAKERGLNVRVESAGTEPDAEVAPAVAAHLTRNGYPIPVTRPRQVTSHDVSTADFVISIGCDLKDLPAPRGALLKWDDVPAPSENFARADEEIRKRVLALVDELIRMRDVR